MLGSTHDADDALQEALLRARRAMPTFGNQRAALLLFEVLGFSAREIADVMGTTTASVTSALQRARRVVAERVPDAPQQSTLRHLGGARVRDVVGRFTAAMKAGDADGLVALLTEDVTWSMPPSPTGTAAGTPSWTSCSPYRWAGAGGGGT